MPNKKSESTVILSEWMKVAQVGQLTRDASLKTRRELEEDKNLAEKVAALRLKSSA